MRPYSRIEADVDLDEEAELRRLEDGTPDGVLGEQPLLPVMQPAVCPQLPAQMTRQLDPEPFELDKAPDACSAMLQRGVADPGVAGQLQLIGRVITFTKSDGLEVTITLPDVANVRLGAASADFMVAKIVMHNGELYILHFDCAEDRTSFMRLAELGLEPTSAEAASSGAGSSSSAVGRTGNRASVVRGDSVTAHIAQARNRLKELVA